MEHTLSVLEPEGLDAEAGGRQARKSALTRTEILEAAIDCLGEAGYARTTMQAIADRAGLSRGAMLHHYATRMQLTAAMTDYIFWKRMKLFHEGVAALGERERVEELQGLELLWQSFHGREFAAQLELAVAARTDQAVQAIYEEKSASFNRLWEGEVRKLFPEWKEASSRLRLAMDFSQAALEGLYLNRAAIAGSARRRAVRRLVADVVAMLRNGDLGRA